MKYVLFLIAILFSNQAVALNCEKQPTCEELNYSKEDDPQCAEDGYVLCPFDFSYKKCLQPDCESLGFTQSEKSDWCADIAHCITDSAYTACQSPCLATTYEELSTLAESGKCKVITMKNDITIPQNQSITLATNTMIDGGNHTLNSSGNQGFNVYTLNNNSGFKNIFIKHNQTQTQENLNVFNAPNAYVTLQNTQILMKSDDKVDHVSALFPTGQFEISGNFTVHILAQKHYVLSWASLIFKNADINITATASDAFVNYTSFTDSRGIITITGNHILYDKEISVSNSQIHLNTPNNSIFYTDKKQGTIHLKDNAELKLTFKSLSNLSSTDSDNLAHIKFESSANAPATLIVEGNERLNLADVTVNNTANTLILNGVTYHPKQIGTVLLSQIPNSADWIQE